jgi:hypothetical protein
MDYSNPSPTTHTNFYAFRLSVADREVVLQSMNYDKVDGQVIDIFRNILIQGVFGLLTGRSIRFHQEFVISKV